MKASEVLRRYTAGERDFRRANLRGQNFKGQDLSGADFSEADIRGANFSRVNLTDVKFIGAISGLMPCWTVCLIIFSESMALVTGAASGLANLIASSAVSATFIQKYSLIPTVVIFAVVASFFVVGIRYGTTVALSVLAWTFGLVWTLAWLGARDSASDWTLALVLALGWAWLWAWAGILIEVVVEAPWVWIWIGSLVCAWMLAGTIASAWTMTLAWVVAGFASLVVSLLGAYAGRNALKGDVKFAFIRFVMIALGSIRGTSFYQANLCKTDFSGAALNNADLRSFKFEQVCLQNAQKLDRARLGNSILANPVVRDLLVTRNGYKKSFMDANLRSANLDGVDLEGANLTWADLTCATVRYANLKDANLTESLVLDTDFTGATLTGACLEAWNIDHNTNLSNVDCQYVYLLRNQQERRPSSGDFAPGEFTKLFQEVLSTVDLIFRNGIDWKAFAYSFNQLVLDNEGTELSIQSIENKGDGVVVVRVNAPPDADKAKLHSEFNQTYELAVKALEAKYQAELQAKDEQITIYRQQSADMLEITRLMANRPIHVQAIAEAKSMNNSADQSQSFNVSGDFNINATNSVVNLRDISGTVTNTINQLPDASTAGEPNLKELLSQLQQAIETEPNLPDKGKETALEQVKVLAEVGQNPKQPGKKAVGQQAANVLKGAASFLPDTAKLAEAVSKLLPLILKTLGL